jgi:haloalkane dehalogenase
LLRESPRSPTSLIPLMTALSQDYCCIAFETPGYGASDPPADRFLPISDFSDSLLEAITALGIDTFHLYGSHTGAS